MKTVHLIFCFFLCLISFSQELPPIEEFTSTDYGGENQNWMISQDSINFIYVANNKGLLEYNGSKWTLYPSPNNSIFRSVKVIANRIYTGCYEDFGYWERNDYGRLTYTSLAKILKDKKLEDDQIWNIVDYDKRIVFQSGHDLFFYHKSSHKIQVISSENIIYKVFNINNEIYYHVADEGIYSIKEGKPKKIINDEVVLEDRVINMFQRDDQIHIITRNSGVFKINKENSLSLLNIPANDILNQFNIFVSITLDDDSIIAGTISNGIIKISIDGNIEYILNQKKGLGNNTVLSLFEDNEKNVWAGLDNGINCINIASAINTFIDYDGVLGTVYTTIIFKENLYVGTNQGLFFRPLKSTNDAFTFINGTAGQVWNLYNDKNQNLLCGHHIGTLIIEGGNAKVISSALGTWTIKKIPDRDDLLMQGTYDGLYILEKNDTNWELRNKIKGFKNSSRFFEITSFNEVLVNHEYKGVYGVKLNASFTEVSEVHLHKELKLGENSSLISYRNEILHTSKDGIFKFIEEEKTFEKDTVLSSLIPRTFNSDKMIVDERGRLWIFSQNNISYIINDDLTNKPEIKNIALPVNLRKGVLGFENLQQIESNKYLLGTSNGYLSLNLNEMASNKDFNIFLSSITTTGLDENKTRISLTKQSEFDHKLNQISFNYTVPNYNKYLDVKYQYRLIGQNERWSAWSKTANANFENLSFGDYTLEAKAKVGNQPTANIITYSFKVNRPWYISNLALILYFFALIILGFLVHKAYKLYYQRIFKHEQIKSERRIIQIKNEKLNQDIESKNRELVISTMSIIKKNELLNKIKKELKNKQKKEDLGSAIDLIDDNLNNNKDWKFFKQAFNNADKDFLDKIKAAHPDLTPNDLKFCAYLRLNLSSKEMAPLLNISIKSVETKRYRLRKRLGLKHDEGLVNYILKF